MRGDAYPRPAWQVLRLPCGRLVTIGAYVRGFYAARGLPPATPVRGYFWHNAPAAEVVRDYRRAIDDRVNARGGFTPRDLTLHRRLILTAKAKGVL